MLLWYFVGWCLWPAFVFLVDILHCYFKRCSKTHNKTKCKTTEMVNKPLIVPVCLRAESGHTGSSSSQQMSCVQNSQLHLRRYKPPGSTCVSINTPIKPPSNTQELCVVSRNGFTLEIHCTVMGTFSSQISCELDTKASLQ